MPRFDSAIFSRGWEKALWDIVPHGSPRPRMSSERQYSDRKLRSRTRSHAGAFQKSLTPMEVSIYAQIGRGMVLPFPLTDLPHGCRDRNSESGVAIQQRPCGPELPRPDSQSPAPSGADPTVSSNASLSRRGFFGGIRSSAASVPDPDILMRGVRHFWRWCRQRLASMAGHLGCGGITAAALRSAMALRHRRVSYTPSAITLPIC